MSGQWQIDPWGVYSVWRRHAKVYQKTWLVNFLPPVTEPLVYFLAFGYGLSPVIGELQYLGSAVSYPQFIAPGMIGIALFFQAFFEGAYGTFIRLEYQRTWHGLLTAPLTFTQVFMGDWLWATTRGMISGIITLAVTMILGFYPWSGLLISLPYLLLGSMLFSAFGLWNAAIVQTIDQINVPVFMLLVPMFTLCGTYFPRDNLPDLLNKVATVLPLSAVVDLLRWPLGLPQNWIWQLSWLFILTIGWGYLAWRQLRSRLFR